MEPTAGKYSRSLPRLFQSSSYAPREAEWSWFFHLLWFHQPKLCDIPAREGYTGLQSLYLLPTVIFDDQGTPDRWLESDSNGQVFRRSFPSRKPDEDLEGYVARCVGILKVVLADVHSKAVGPITSSTPFMLVWMKGQQCLKMTASQLDEVTRGQVRRSRILGIQPILPAESEYYGFASNLPADTTVADMLRSNPALLPEQALASTLAKSSTVQDAIEAGKQLVVGVDNSSKRAAAKLANFLLPKLVIHFPTGTTRTLTVGITLFRQKGTGRLYLSHASHMVIQLVQSPKQLKAEAKEHAAATQSAVESEKDELERHRALAAALVRKPQFTGRTLDDVWRTLDTANRGAMSPSDILSMFRVLGIRLSSEQRSTFLRWIKRDQFGLVTQEEFVAFFAPVAREIAANAAREPAGKLRKRTISARPRSTLASTIELARSESLGSLDDERAVGLRSLFATKELSADDYSLKFLQLHETSMPHRGGWVASASGKGGSGLPSPSSKPQRSKKLMVKPLKDVRQKPKGVSRKRRGPSSFAGDALPPDARSSTVALLSELEQRWGSAVARGKGTGVRRGVRGRGAVGRGDGSFTSSMPLSLEAIEASGTSARDEDVKDEDSVELSEAIATGREENSEEEKEQKEEGENSWYIEGTYRQKEVRLAGDGDHETEYGTQAMERLMEEALHRAEVARGVAVGRDEGDVPLKSLLVVVFADVFESTNALREALSPAFARIPRVNLVVVDTAVLVSQVWHTLQAHQRSRAVVQEAFDGAARNVIDVLRRRYTGDNAAAPEDALIIVSFGLGFPVAKAVSNSWVANNNTAEVFPPLRTMLATSAFLPEGEATKARILELVG